MAQSPSHTTTPASPSIESIAARLSLDPAEWVPYGEGVGKLRASAAFAAGSKKHGKLVLVSAVNPTPAGEGKTTMTIALSDGLRARGVNVVAALRQPSLGPTLGSKGGGAGGGRARLEPFERVNLGLTGDIHAVTAAHNLLASLIDNALQFNTTNLDPRRVDFPRVLDLDDRSLRHVVVGLGGPLHGTPRETRFDITAASEVMAILCLAKNYADLKVRLGAIRVGTTRDGVPVTAGELGAVAGMAVVLREAMLPNLVQTQEGTPALVHGGPFGNIAHGCSSVVQTRFALSKADVVVTEAGFGFDLGAEKFLHIKTRAGDVWPDALVLVATVRALKYHGGVDAKDLGTSNVAALMQGGSNLRQHVQTARLFGLNPVIAINLFPTDTEEELQALESLCKELGVSAARVGSYAKGTAGGLALAELVQDVLSKTPETSAPKHLYSLDQPLADKIEIIAKTVYGATGVEYSPAAKRDLARAEANGMAGAPVCMAKTHLSLTADPLKRGMIQEHVLPVVGVRVSAGAGFVVALSGDIMTMPGLGKNPAVLSMGLTDDGEILGLK